MRGAAIFPTALAALAITLGTGSATVRLGNSAPAALAERARPAGAFTDSIGVNVHLSYGATGYGNSRGVTALLERLGVRHVRDGITPGATGVCRAARALAATGIRFTYITQAHPAPEGLTEWVACVGPAIEAFEGLNEYDISHPAADSNWVATVRSSQAQLYRAVKDHPSLARYTVVGPSLTSDRAFRSVGELSSSVDAGNMHDYFAGHEPETNGWGLGGYGSVAYNIRIARAVASAKPIEATETGYGTDAVAKSVDATAQATYLPRLFLTHFAAGVVRTFDYELVDEGGEPFAHYGIVDANLAPKPAFTALAALIAVVRDASGSFSTGRLRYTIDDGRAGVRHVLLQKRDGRFILALWNASSSYDPAAQRSLTVSPEAVTLQIATPIRSAAQYAYGSDWRLHRTALPDASALHVEVDGRVTLVELTPAQGLRARG